MDALFSGLTHALEGAPAIAFAAALAWGALSIILSPCHLASIPLIIGFIDDQGRVSAGHAFRLSLLFAVGILTTLIAIGGITAGLGRIMGDIGRWVNYPLALVFFIIGLHLMGIFTIPFPGMGRLQYKRKGLLAALVLGLVFGIALGPCTFAFLAPMLGISLKLGGTEPLFAAGLFIAFAIGHCGVLVAAGTSTGLVQKFLNWNEQSRGSRMLKQVCGLLVILGGLYLLWTA